MPTNKRPNPNTQTPFGDVTGVILAGGLSRRMGRDKAALTINGVTLLDRAVRIFDRLFARNLIAGDRPDLARPNLPAFADEFPGSALGGLYTGLSRAQTPYIFVAACDMPCIDPALIQLLLSQRHDYDVVLPQTSAGLEPLFACYSKACLDIMRRQLEADRFRITDLYPLLNTRVMTTAELPVHWKQALTNVNTPEDIQNLKKEDLC